MAGETACPTVLQELIRIIEQPRRCSYLPREKAALEIRAVTDMAAAEYAEFLARGYRRFGWQVFRPACPNCVSCVSLRVLAHRFEPDASERRILRKNETVRAELRPLFAAPEMIELYNRYHRFMGPERGWPREQTTLASYQESFLSGASSHGRQWLYFDGGRLIGVALMDEVPGAISLVYCYYDPDWRPRSPGTFSVLNQLLYAKSRGFDYAYLGYQIDDCGSMRYKKRFRPHETLMEYPADGYPPVWKEAP